MSVFNQELLTQSMPGQVFPMVLEPIGADTIEAATNAGEPLPFIQFALMAGCETSEFANGGIGNHPRRPTGNPARASWNISLHLWS